MSGPFWMALVNNGTSITCSVSFDRQNWIPAGGEAISAHVGTITHMGAHVNFNNGTAFARNAGLQLFEIGYH